MNHKKIVGIMFVVSLVILGGIFLGGGGLGVDYFCPTYEQGGRECIDLTSNIIEPFLWASLSLLFVTLPLFFVRREVFLAWAKFASVAFPLLLGVLLYVYNNEPETSGYIGGLGSDESLATRFLPPFFAIASILIIVHKYLQLKKLKRWATVVKIIMALLALLALAFLALMYS